jgi:hypothetical protein
VVERGEIRVDVEGAVHPRVDQIPAVLLGEEHQVRAADLVLLELDDRGNPAVREGLDERDGENGIPVLNRERFVFRREEIVIPLIDLTMLHGVTATNGLHSGDGHSVLSSEGIHRHDLGRDGLESGGPEPTVVAPLER